MKFEDIVSALEHCGNRKPCKGCPSFLKNLDDDEPFETCQMIYLEAARLLRNQKALIECLKETSEHHREANGALLAMIDKMS